MVEISLANKRYIVTRPKLRKWLDVEKFREQSLDSADRKDDAGFISGIYSFLSALVLTDEFELDTIPWYDVLESYRLITLENSVRLDLSILRSGKKEDDNKLPDVWEYDERMWYSWIHLLAREYHWSIEYISELDVDDAFALIQEISLQEQFDKEWEYGLSEVAYEYDKASKKSKLRPLPRPSWMTKATQAVKEKIEQRTTAVVRRTPQKFMPPGLVIVDGQDVTATKPIGSDSTIQNSS